ncbi:MAG: hypothetical protein IJN29_11380, partial [Akkermansia sp.]|nr:hypothetical protein [Akkermansia sp.]
MSTDYYNNPSAVGAGKMTANPSKVDSSFNSVNLNQNNNKLIVMSEDTTYTTQESSVIAETASMSIQPIIAPGCTILRSEEPVNEQPSSQCINEVLLFNSELVVPRDSSVQVYVQMDDEGDLLITRNPLVAASAEARNAAIQAELDAPAADSLLFHRHLQGEEWKHIDDAALWSPEQLQGKRIFALSAGSWYISARLSNDYMAYSSENRKLFRYAIVSLSSEEPHLYTPDASVCPACGCGGDSDGDADAQPASDLPSTPDDLCRAQAFPVLTADGKTALKYDGPWGWSATRNGASITITPTKGAPLCFETDADDASSAHPSGTSRKRNMQVQLQLADGSPCTDGEPARLMLKDDSGRCLVFDAASGAVVATISPDNKLHTQEQRSAQITERMENGLLTCVYSAAEGLMRSTQQEDGGILAEWFAPAAVTVNEDGSFATQGLAYKTAIYRITQENGVLTTSVTRQQRDREAHGSTRVENGDSVVITKGAGAEAVVHTYTTTYPTNGIMQRVVSTKRANDTAPAACSCTTMQYTEGGWLLIEQKQGFGSDAEQTDSFFYGDSFRPERTFRHNGNFSFRVYDVLGRVTLEKSPWGAGLTKITRTTYATARFYDIRPASVAEHHVNASGAEVLFRNTTYSYEESSELERVTTTVTAGGSSQQQVSIEETFGTAPTYAYAAGKPKFSQGIDGVQTVHEYEATTEHGAIHKHTSITKANSELVAAQSRKSESFIAANDTTTFEQESIWNGSQWLLLDTTAYEYDEQQRVTKTTRG